MTCAICKTASPLCKNFIAEEMMNGTHERFGYIECGECGCVFIKDIPPDLERHYAGKYYSFQPQIVRRRNGLKARVREAAMRSRLGSKSLLDVMAASIRRIHFPWLVPGYMTPNSRVLDVGCGSGSLLHELANYGFTDLVGIDPFMPEKAEKSTGNPLLLRCEMGALEGKTFDVVMLHHVFEHLPDPHAALRSITRLLAAQGRILIRAPLAGSYSYRKYGRNWVQLDAPRHLVIPSLPGMVILAQQAGLNIDRVIYDSNSFQFVGSEAYCRGVALGEAQSLFSENEAAGFEQAAQMLNSMNDGDMACFWLSRREGIAL